MEKTTMKKSELRKMIREELNQLKERVDYSKLDPNVVNAYKKYIALARAGKDDKKALEQYRKLLKSTYTDWADRKGVDSVIRTQYGESPKSAPFAYKRYEPTHW